MKIRVTYPEFDVVVCGGGCAGLCAAIMAARQGARVMLIERAGFSGGIITAVGLPYFDGIADATNDRIVLRGLPFEMLVRLGAFPPNATTLHDIQDGHALLKHASVRIPNIEAFKLLADEMLLEHANRIQVLYHTTVCDVEVVDRHIRGLYLANKDGLSYVPARTVIDASGDADVARFAGAAASRSEELMPMTLHFRIGEVEKNPELGDMVKAETIRAGKEGALKMFYGPGIAFDYGPREINIHAVRVPGDASSASDLTRAEMQGRIDAWSMFKWWKKNIPEFGGSYFLTSGPYIGVRETWRIDGVTTLTEEDILARTEFEDGVATGTWYLDIHPNKSTPGTANEIETYWPGTYDIRYGTMLPKGVTNLLVAGRCHSATRRASSSSRVTCTAMAMGQAAGMAAALAVNQKKEPAELSGMAVRDALEALNMGPHRKG